MSHRWLMQMMWMFIALGVLLLIPVLFCVPSPVFFGDRISNIWYSADENLIATYWLLMVFGMYLGWHHQMTKGWVRYRSMFSNEILQKKQKSYGTTGGHV